MAGEVGKLHVTVDARIDALDRNLKTAERRTQRATARMNKVAQVEASGLEKFAKMSIEAGGLMLAMQAASSAVEAAMSASAAFAADARGDFAEAAKQAERAYQSIERIPIAGQAFGVGRSLSGVIGKGLTGLEDMLGVPQGAIDPGGIFRNMLESNEAIAESERKLLANQTRQREMMRERASVRDRLAKLAESERIATSDNVELTRANLQLEKQLAEVQRLREAGVTKEADALERAARAAHERQAAEIAIAKAKADQAAADAEADKRIADAAENQRRAYAAADNLEAIQNRVTVARLEQEGKFVEARKAAVRFEFEQRIRAVQMEEHLVEARVKALTEEMQLRLKQIDEEAKARKAPELASREQSADRQAQQFSRRQFLALGGSAVVMGKKEERETNRKLDQSNTALRGMLDELREIRQNTMVGRAG